MRKIFSMMLACVLVAGLTGCGKSDAEKVMSDTVDTMKEQLAALKSATTEATAKDAGTKVKAAMDDAMKKLGNVANMKITEEDGKKAAEKYKPEMEKVQAEIGTETKRIMADPKLRDAYQKALMGTK